MLKKTIINIIAYFNINEGFKMKIHGNLDLQKNYIKNPALFEVPSLPITSTVGEMVFTGSIVYICVNIIEGVPVWVPLTNIIDSYVHTQTSSSDTWTITHSFGNASLVVQVYDSNGLQFIPNSIDTSISGEITINLSSSQTGKAVIIAGITSTQDGVAATFNSQPQIKVITANFPGVISSSTGTARWYPYADMTIIGVYCSVGTAPSSTVSADVKKGGVSILGGNYPTITSGNYKSNTITLNVDLFTANINDYLTVDVTGSSGEDLVISILYYTYGN